MDDEIDGVARSMTAAAPPAQLRSAVLSRITAHASVSHAWWRWSPAAAVAAVIVVVLVWPDREAAVDAPASPPAVAIVPPATPSIESGPSVGRTLSGSPGEPYPPSPTGFGEARLTNAESLPDGPLVSVGPLVVEPLEDPDPLGVSGIEVPTLTVEAMTVAPLSQQ
jgi:hypothetical protein